MAKADLTTVGMLNSEGDGDSTLTRPHCEPLVAFVILQLWMLPPLLLAKAEEKSSPTRAGVYNTLRPQQLAPNSK